MKNALVLLLVFTVLSCKKESYIDEELLRTGWVLTEIRESNDDIIYEQLDSVRNESIYLVFTSNFELTGYGPALGFSDTEYSIDDNNNMTLNILGPRLPTRQWVSIFISYNHTVFKYNIKNDKLFLIFKENKKFIFKRG